ncbi:MAG TPA: hypothetical protein VNO55_19740 [Polyangia bacterium]|nr:hypothetical protein [Polyangia bacterium]
MADNTTPPDDPDKQTWTPPGNWRDPTSQSNDFWTNLAQAQGIAQHPQGAAQQQSLAAAGWTAQPSPQQQVSPQTLQQIVQMLQQRQPGVARPATPGLLGAAV